MIKRGWMFLVMVAVLCFSGMAKATLWDRGAGLIYDDGLNITWLQNSDLAATLTFDVEAITPEGQMAWSTAVAWIAAMNEANYLGYNDWRLPSMDVNGDGYVLNGNGASEVECRDNELAYMYY